MILALWLLAHSWYPQECCHDKDCRPVPCAEITRTSAGLKWHELTFTKAPGVSPDGECHICLFNGNLLCVFTPVGLT